jgi:hypothetical protein
MAQKILTNPYKRQDVFRCYHEAHRGFGSVVSAFHVLEEKHCYPSGCLWFSWRCRKIGKRHGCPRGFGHVGRECFSCHEFYEERVIHRPEVALPQKEFEAFSEELREFRWWLSQNLGRRLPFQGLVSAVKPRFHVSQGRHRERLSQSGFLLGFREGFFGNSRMEDRFYGIAGDGLIQRLRIVPGTQLEGEALLLMDRGRLVLERLSRLEVLSPGEGTALTRSEALISQATATVFQGQPERCFSCPRGALLDVWDEQQNLRHRVACLDGRPEPKDCSYAAELLLAELERCAEQDRTEQA